METNKTGNQNKKIIIILAVLFLAVLMYFLINNLLNVEGQIPALPPLPGLQGKSDILASELRSRDQAARAQDAGADAIANLAQFYHANLFFDQAETCYRIATKKDPANPRWHYLLAYLRQKMGSTQGVVPLLQKVIDLDQKYYPARLKLADIYFKSGKMDDAREQYQSLIQQEKGTDSQTYTPYAYFGLGRISVQAHKWEDARQYLQKSIAQNPGFGTAHRILADVHKHFGNQELMKRSRVRARNYRFAEAIDPWVDQLVNHCYDRGEILRLADIAFKTANADQVGASIKQVIKLYPDHLEVYLRLGQNLNAIGAYEQALQYYNRALELETDNIEALSNCGHVLIQLKQYDEAETKLRRALELDPDNDGAEYNMGYIMFYRGNNVESLRHFNRAIKINPADARYHYGLGIVAKKMFSYEAAIKYFSKALEIDPNLEDAHFNIGLLLSSMGNKDQAIQQYKEELSVNPDSAACHFVLGNEYTHQRNVVDAVEHYREALAIDPHLHPAHKNLAMAYEYLGKKEQAMTHFKKVVELQPDDPFSYLVMGNAYIRYGETQDAIAQFQQALNKAQKKGDASLAANIKKFIDTGAYQREEF